MAAPVRTPVHPRVAALLALVLTAWATGGCAGKAKSAGPQPPEPPRMPQPQESGRLGLAPQVLVSGVPAELVRARLISRLVDRGWEVSAVAADSLVFENALDSGAMRALFGVGKPAGARAHLRFHFREEGASTRIFVVGEMTARRNGRVERLAASADPQLLQENLQAVKREEFGQ